MLSELHIRDFAIIDHLALEFGPGMSVLTGETGAGKSIAIDALGLALGNRADSSVVRQGRERAEIVASFLLPRHSPVRAWLAQHELDDGDDCILRRTLAASGGSKAYINGRPVPLQLLRGLAEQLVDIFGQHQHQSLLRGDEQRRLLDGFGGHQALSREVEAAFRQWQQTQQNWQRLRASEHERESRRDFLRFQIEELENCAPQPDEWQNLEKEHRQLAHAEEINATLQHALGELYEHEHALLPRLQSLVQSLDENARYRGELGDIAKLLGSAAIELEEAALELRRLSAHDEVEPGRLEHLERRMGELADLARKHRCEPGELPAVHQRLREELNSLDTAQHDLDTMSETLRQHQQRYQELASRLSVKRQQAAKALGQAITRLLPQLGMPHAELHIELSPHEQPRAHGLESVTFLVATHPGQTPRPLGKIASGGELSRISLATQVVTSQLAHIPTLVFDEVDVGIGGQVAETVGRLLRQLATERQILCITHQAQVAAQGHAHLRVVKQIDADRVLTHIENLEADARSDEIARMIGGSEITPRTREHAREMLQRAQGD